MRAEVTLATGYLRASWRLRGVVVTLAIALGVMALTGLGDLASPALLTPGRASTGSFPEVGGASVGVALQAVAVARASPGSDHVLEGQAPDAQARWLWGLLSLATGTLTVAAAGHRVIEGRRRDLVVLRAAGASRWTIAAVVLIECLVPASLGSLLGVMAAQASAGRVLKLAVPTADLLSIASVGAPNAGAGLIAQAIVLGVGMAALGGLWPALAAIRYSSPDAPRPPTALAVKRRMLPSSFAALLLVVLGAVLLAMGDGAGGALSSCMFLAGLAFASPALARHWMKLGGRLLALVAPGEVYLAWSGLSQQATRAALAITMLMFSLAVQVPLAALAATSEESQVGLTGRLSCPDDRVTDGARVLPRACLAVATGLTEGNQARASAVLADSSRPRTTIEDAPARTGAASGTPSVGTSCTYLQGALGGASAPGPVGCDPPDVGLRGSLRGVWVLLSLFGAALAIPAVIVVEGTWTSCILARAREIGTLYLVGGTRQQVRCTVLAEGLLLAALGAALGMLAGAWLSCALALGGNAAGLWVQSRAYLAVVAWLLPVGLLVGLAGAAAAGRQCNRVGPAQALHHD